MKPIMKMMSLIPFLADYSATTGISAVMGWSDRAFQVASAVTQAFCLSRWAAILSAILRAASPRDDQAASRSYGEQ
jgi:hypothetical protein